MPTQSLYFLFLLILNVASTPTWNSLSASHSLKVSPHSTKSTQSQLFGFVFGPILFVLSFYFIWLNQKRSAINWRRLTLAQSLLNDAPPQEYNLQNGSSMPIVPQKQLKYNQGFTQIIESARDPQYHVNPQDAIKIIRKVQVRECRAEGTRRSQADQIDKVLMWVDQNIQECIDEMNPTSMWFINTQQFTAQKVKVGSYFLSQQQIQALQCDTQFVLTPQCISALVAQAQASHNPSEYIILNDEIYFPFQNGDINSKGTVKISYMYCAPTVVSLLCAVDFYSQSYSPFQIDILDNAADDLSCRNGVCGKIAEMMKPIKQINFIKKGEFTQKQMIDSGLDSTSKQTFLIRVASFLIMAIGICIFFGPIVSLIGYVPIVGGFLKGATSIIIIFGAFLVTIPMFLLTTSFAWIRYHPKVGIILLALTCGIFLIYLIFPSE